jgi:protease I
MAKDKAALLVVACYNFRDEEYRAVREKLEKLGYRITIASTVRQGATSLAENEVDPELLIDEVNPDDYEAIIFIGGPGACQYWYDAVVHDICRHAARDGKLVGALSHASVALAASGVLKGKRATGHASIFDKVITEHGEFTGKPVERDGNVITGEGGRRAGEFAEALAQALGERA